MKYVQMTLDDWLREKEAIRTDLTITAEAFVRIGCRLRKIRDGKLYEQDGYKNISEFAQAEYGLKKNTTSNFIGIAEKFVKPGTMELEDRYKGMGSSILSEMLTVSEENRELITKDTTRAQLRELKQFEKQQPEETYDDFDGVIVEFFRNRQEVLNSFYTSEAYTTGDMEELVYILNPHGNQTFRKGNYIVFFYDLEQGIKYKIYPEKESYKMTYAELISRMQEIYKDAISGSNTHTAYYGEPEKIAEATVETVPPKEDKKEPEKEPKKVPPAELKPRINPECEGISEKTEKVAESNLNEAERNNPEEEKDPVPEEKSKDLPQGEIKTEHNPEENTEQETQKTPESCINTECEQIPEQVEVEEVLPAEVQQDVQESKDTEFAKTRKEYLDECTEYGAALYLNRHLSPEILKNTDALERWLKETVDINGREIEEVEDNVRATN